MGSLTIEEIEVGDRVRVVSFKETGPTFGFIGCMAKVVGFVGTVNKIIKSKEAVVIKHPNYTNTWMWHPGDLEMHNKNTNQFCNICGGEWTEELPCLCLTDEEQSDDRLTTGP